MTQQLAELKAATDDVEAAVDDGQAGLDAFAETADEPAADHPADDEESDAAATDAGLTDFAAESRETAGDDAGDENDAGDSDAGDTTDGGNDGIVATAGRETGVEVVVDQRELDSTIAKDLSTWDGLTTRLETLAVGDYVLSDRVAVERKSAADFVDSVLDADRSLFTQVGELSRAYARPTVVVEGSNLYGQRNVEPNAIRGALASLAVDFGVSVLRTESEADRPARDYRSP